jgi:hypothetical protein
MACPRRTLCPRASPTAPGGCAGRAPHLEVRAAFRVRTRHAREPSGRGPDLQRCGAMEQRSPAVPHADEGVPLAGAPRSASSSRSVSPTGATGRASLAARRPSPVLEPHDHPHVGERRWTAPRPRRADRPRDRRPWRAGRPGSGLSLRQRMPPGLGPGRTAGPPAARPETGGEERPLPHGRPVWPGWRAAPSTIGPRQPSRTQNRCAAATHGPGRQHLLHGGGRGRAAQVPVRDGHREG